MKFKLVEFLIDEGKEDINNFIKKFGEERYNRYNQLKKQIEKFKR